MPTDTRRDALFSIVLLAFVAASQIGFMGYYDRSGFRSMPATLTLALMMAAGIATFAILPRKFFVGLCRQWPLLLFAAWAVVTSLASDYVDISLRRSALILVPGILLAAGATADPWPDKTFQHVTILLAGLAVASFAFSLISLAFGTVTAIGPVKYFIVHLWHGVDAGLMVGGRRIDLLRLELPRPSGLTGNPNSMALLSMLALCMLWAKQIPRSSITFSTRLLLALLMASMLLTMSRAALIALIVFAAMLPILRYRSKDLSLLALLLVLLAPVFITFIVLAVMHGLVSPPPLYGSPEFLQNEGLSLGERLQIWGAALSAMPAHLVAGLGFGVVQEALYRPLKFATTAQSTPFGILLETGLPGLVLLFLVWLRPVRVALNGPDGGFLAKGIAAILLAIYVHQSVDNAVFRFHSLHFLFCYLIGAAANPALAGLQPEPGK